MTTRRETILAAVKVMLDGLSPTAFRDLAREYTGADLPAVNLLDGGHELVTVYSGLRRYEMRPAIEIVVAGDTVTGSDLGAALNAVYGEIMAAVDAEMTRDDGLPPLAVAGVIRIDEVGLGDLERVHAAKPYFGAELELVIEFETAEADVSAAP